MMKKFIMYLGYTGRPGKMSDHIWFVNEKIINAEQKTIDVINRFYRGFGKCNAFLGFQHNEYFHNPKEGRST